MTPQNHFYNLPQLTNSNSTMNAAIAAAASPAETKVTIKDKTDKHKLEKHKADKHKSDKSDYRHLPNISNFWNVWSGQGPVPVAAPLPQPNPLPHHQKRKSLLPTYSDREPVQPPKVEEDSQYSNWYADKKPAAKLCSESPVWSKDKQAGKASHFRNVEWRGDGVQAHQVLSDSPHHHHYPFPIPHQPHLHQGDAQPSKLIPDYLRKESQSECGSASPIELQGDSKMLKKLSTEILHGRLESRSDYSHSPASVQMLEERGVQRTAGSNISGASECSSRRNAHATRPSLPKLEGGIANKQFKRWQMVQHWGRSELLPYSVIICLKF